MSSSLVCKSIFNVQLQNKKNILIGYQVFENDLTVAIALECNVSKQTLIFDQSLWTQFINENNFQLIFENISTCHSKKVKLNNNFLFKINSKSESVTLQLNNDRLTLSRHNLFRISQLSDCISSSINEKCNSLKKYCTWYNIILDKIEKEVLHFPHECLREDFLSKFIIDYNFDVQNLCDKNRSFTLELQQIHFVKLATIIISRITRKLNLTY